MSNRGPFSTLRILALLLLLGAVVLITLQLITYSRIRNNLPINLRIGGIPVGGLTDQEAAQRILDSYTTPIELRYNGAPIQVNPVSLDFELDTESMLASANVERTQRFFWSGFWDFLWSRTPASVQVPLKASTSEKRIREYLTDISLRYDQPAQPAQPQPGSTTFTAGEPGAELEIDNSVSLIENAMKSLNNRVVDLPIRRTQPGKPAFENLGILLRQVIDTSGYDGLASLYLLDLESGKEIQFAHSQGEDITSTPDVAFTASSIIKIPIMVSSFRQMGEEPDAESLKLMADMIELSGNEAADWLMERVMDPNLAPLLVTEDMQQLGLENTFLAGKFSLGSPLLQRFDTPANTRTDINTDPDPYSQTTASDMGMLLEDIYLCAENDGGALRAVFPEEISQRECQLMNTHLINNRLPVLITAGVPEGTQVAHKHGWVSTNGIINTIGDAGIVYTLGGNYVLVIFLHHPDQLIWDSASELVARLSQTVYNYYNPPATGGN